MFGDIVDPSVKVGTKQWYTVPLSVLAHTMVVEPASGLLPS